MTTGIEDQGPIKDFLEKLGISDHPTKPFAFSKKNKAYPKKGKAQSRPKQNKPPRKTM